MHNIQAVLFDFDDTLQDREAAYRAYCAAFLGEFFPALPPEEKARRIDEMEAHIEGGYRKREEYFPEMIALWGWESHPPVELLCRHFNEHYGEHVALFPDAIPTIQALKEQGYLLGVVSNGPSVLQNKKLDTAGIRDLFDVVAVSGDYGIHKPDRRLFDLAAQKLNVPNEACLFVGDHPVNDIKGALGAGMQAYGWITAPLPGSAHRACRRFGGFPRCSGCWRICRGQCSDANSHRVYLDPFAIE